MGVFIPGPQRVTNQGNRAELGRHQQGAAHFRLSGSARMQLLLACLFTDVNTIHKVHTLYIGPTFGASIYLL
jgi:hypothetical protein